MLAYMRDTMKKKLLFVIPSLLAGGGQKSLINLLSQIDYQRFEVDLLLFSKTGAFMNAIPKEVQVVALTYHHPAFAEHLAKSVTTLIAHRQFKLAYARLMFAALNRFVRNTASSEQYSWEYLKRSFGTLDREYDVAIGYLEKSSIYYIVDRVKAAKKIGWIHTNYADSGMIASMDEPYFKQLDKLVTVSEECARSLKETFTELTDNITVIQNIVSPRIIKSESNREPSVLQKFDGEFTNIITVARLSHEKGIDMAINACSLLVNQGYKVKWYILGDGAEREALENQIVALQLQDTFILLGIQENPYPFIKNADMYVQPSRYEGKSIAIDEAKILNKPIVVTNYESAKDQITDGVNGLLVEMSDVGISKGIEVLINQFELRESFIQSLAEEQMGTEEEVYKLYDII
ncbi:UDP-N-acetylglucosamine--peptide N-acetylglucosaminyltransferase GtfA subunit [Paenibacillus allorhizoplanae]|uniref:UDP-N-acetylglucosamine--peptide N-acetylglucosaminyltransferase GtfA subunit n=2 Tax=Paenibacillus allorhizoplanae TaxID=2905648 RepID=A0ABN8GFF7_9BACL|nr:UDP-N-acetylglucosamine--peptide N-acetylglucosaminyltransferase GtfA subunit [Paenibacillus allorhizoplanae]